MIYQRYSASAKIKKGSRGVLIYHGGCPSLSSFKPQTPSGYETYELRRTRQNEHSLYHSRDGSIERHPRVPPQGDPEEMASSTEAKGNSQHSEDYEDRPYNRDCRLLCILACVTLRLGLIVRHFEIEIEKLGFYIKFLCWMMKFVQNEGANKRSAQVSARWWYLWLPSMNAFPVDGRVSVYPSSVSFPILRLTYSHKIVPITGASRGLELEAGRQLAARGANAIILPRDEQRLRDGVAYMQEALVSKSQRFHHIKAELTSCEQAVRAIQEATAWNAGSPPDIVWCCAGASHPTLFIDTDVSAFRSQMDSNYFTAVSTSHVILRA